MHVPIRICDIICNTPASLATSLTFLRFLLYSLLNHELYIKTHGSESRGQEEAGLHDEQVSYLQVAPL